MGNSPPYPVPYNPVTTPAGRPLGVTISALTVTDAQVRGGSLHSLSVGVKHNSLPRLLGPVESAYPTTMRVCADWTSLVTDSGYGPTLQYQWIVNK